MSVLDGDTRIVQRVYASALQAIEECIATDAEIERRLAVIVFFTYNDATVAGSDVVDEAAMIALCVDRLLAQTAPIRRGVEAI